MNEAGWTSPEDYVIAGNCIKLKDVNGIDGDPGDTLVVMSWATSRVDLPVTGRKVKVTDKGGPNRGRGGFLYIVGGGPFINSAGENEVAVADVIVPFNDEDSIVDIMGHAVFLMRNSGWSVDYAAGTAEFVVHTLPGGHIIDALTLSIEYVDGDTPPELEWHWSIEFVDD